MIEKYTGDNITKRIQEVSVEFVNEEVTGISHDDKASIPSAIK